MFDIVIKGGTIIDGTGNVGFKGDLAIEGDRLKILVGDTSSVSAAKIIDASQSIVAPGFIDVHTHSSLIALADKNGKLSVTDVLEALEDQISDKQRLSDGVDHRAEKLLANVPVAGTDLISGK